MRIKEFNIGLPIKDNYAKEITGVVQFDTANIFNIKLIENNKGFDYSDYTDIVITIRKPDGKVMVDSEGDNLQVVEPSEGRLSFVLMEQATVVTGLHLCTISLYTNGVKMTTARLNYYVQDSLEGDDGTLPSLDEYPILQQLIAENSRIKSSESDRIDAEALRQANEEDRIVAESERDGRIYDAEQRFEEAISRAEAAAQEAKAWSQATITGALDGLSLVTPEMVEQMLDDRFDLLDAGLFGSEELDIRVLRGHSGDLGVLKEGQLAVTLDTRSIYLGTDTGNILLNPKTTKGSTAPLDTSVLWIDTSSDPVLKYHNGSTWAPLNHVVFG